MPKRKIFRDSDSDADPEEGVESPNEDSPASSDGKSQQCSWHWSFYQVDIK